MRKRLHQAFNKRRSRPENVDNHNITQPLDDLTSRLSQRSCNRYIFRLHHAIDNFESTEPSQFNEAIPERHLIRLVRPKFRQRVFRKRMGNNVSVTPVLDWHIEYRAPPCLNATKVQFTARHIDKM